MFSEPHHADPSSPAYGVPGVIRAAAAAVFSIDPLVAGMVAAGLGLDALEAYLDLSRNELLDRLAELALPVPHGRPLRRGGRNPWTAAEVRAFISLWMAGIRIAAITAVLCRSPGGIYSKRRRLGLPARPRKGQRDLSAAEIEAWRARVGTAAAESSAPAVPAEVSEPAPTEAGKPPAAPVAPLDPRAEHAADGVAVAAAASEPALSETLPFAAGDHVVVPPYGVGRFDGVRTETVKGAEIEMLSIAIVNPEMKLKIAVSRAAARDLRKVSSPDAANAALAVLAMPGTKGVKLPCNKQKVASCDLGALAEAVRDLWTAAPGWDWATRSLYEKALGLFAGEIAKIRNVSEADVRREIAWRLPRIKELKSQGIKIVASDGDPEVTAFMCEIAQRAKESSKEVEPKGGRGHLIFLEVAARVLGGQKTAEVAKIIALTPKSVSCIINRLGLGDRSRKQFLEFSRARADQYLSEKGLFPRMCEHYRRLMFTDSPNVRYSPEYHKKSTAARLAGQAAGIDKRKAPKSKWKGISPAHAESRARLKANWEKSFQPGREGGEAGDGIHAAMAELETAPA